MVRKLSHVEIWSLLSFFLLSLFPFLLPSFSHPSLHPSFSSLYKYKQHTFWGIPQHSEKWLPILQAQMKKYFSYLHPLRGQRHVTGSAITSLCRLQVERWWDSGGNRGSTFSCTIVSALIPSIMLRWFKLKHLGSSVRQVAGTPRKVHALHLTFSFSIVQLVYIEVQSTHVHYSVEVTLYMCFFYWHF